MALRILASIILLFAVLFLPFWVYFLLALAGILYFRFFAEAVVLLFLSDLLYGVKEPKFGGVVFVSFIISLVFMILAEFSKKKIKFYPYK